MLGMYQGGNPCALVETGIYDQYARADGSFSAVANFRFSALVKFLFF